MLELIVLLLLGVLVCLIILIWQVASLQSKLGRLLLPTDPLPIMHMHSSQMTGTGFFVIWEWRENRWRVAPGVVHVPGTDVGPEPAYPGAYEGDKVKTWVQSPR